MFTHFLLLYFCVVRSLSPIDSTPQILCHSIGQTVVNTTLTSFTIIRYGTVWCYFARTFDMYSHVNLAYIPCHCYYAPVVLLKCLMHYLRLLCSGYLLLLSILTAGSAIQRGESGWLTEKEEKQRNGWQRKRGREKQILLELIGPPAVISKIRIHTEIQINECPS